MAYAKLLHRLATAPDRPPELDRLALLKDADQELELARA